MSRVLSERFSQSTTGALDTRVRLIRPDLAVIHWSWWIEGGKNFDGSPRPKRVGLMTMLAHRRANVWQLIVAHNTNFVPGAAAPEEVSINSPIVMPTSLEKK
jgi:hypothetical protein